MNNDRAEWNEIQKSDDIFVVSNYPSSLLESSLIKK